MDHDLLEVTIPQLEALYAQHRYTVREVTEWYLDRIARFDGRYKALITVNRAEALAVAGEEDKAARRPRFHPGPLFGVPMVIKSNTSLKGLITNDGWQGFQLPEHPLRATQDATVTRRLRAAGAVFLAQTNMPDFAASDTNKSSAFGRTGNAYDARFSPGGSSGGTVTAVTANFALLGTGSDTANSIRMPSGTSSVVGVLPTRGLVSIAGIAPLDWLLDNTGPIARDVTDAAITLAVMAGSDAADARTEVPEAKVAAAKLVAGKALNPNSLQGVRLGVPAFIVAESEAPITSIAGQSRDISLRPETRSLFLAALDELRAAGATLVLDPELMPDSFSKLTQLVNTRPYRREGMETFLKNYAPPGLDSAEAYAQTTRQALPAVVLGPVNTPQQRLETDPAAEANFYAPQRAALAAYNETLARFHLDGLVYPAAQMPPNDETVAQPDGRPSSGPHSNTGWVNRIGVPAVVVPAGFYASGLPIGLELSARRWQDRELLDWAFAYEQQTHHRQPPVLVPEPRAPEN